MRIRPSAILSISPASTITILVASPIWPGSAAEKNTGEGRGTSASCCSLAITSSFAAGCTTSSSRRIVAASDVRIIFCRWLITILLRPHGPSDVCTVEAIARHASILRITAPSSLE